MLDARCRSWLGVRESVNQNQRVARHMLETTLFQPVTHLLLSQIRVNKQTDE